MAMMKDFLMTVEERIYDALELGFRTDEEIYSYVYMYEDRVQFVTVKEFLKNIVDSLDESDYALYNPSCQ
jgi:hypothetical protein